MSAQPDVPKYQPRTLSDIVPDDNIDGLLLDLAAAADTKSPQAVEDYARRRELGILSVDPLVQLELRDATAEREVVQLERDFRL